MKTGLTSKALAAARRATGNPKLTVKEAVALGMEEIKKKGIKGVAKDAGKAAGKAVVQAAVKAASAAAFGLAFKALRTSLKITQESAAAVLGATTREISNWEHGRVKLNLYAQTGALSLLPTAKRGSARQKS